MSVDYAAGLSEYDDLGVCGVAEIVEPKSNLDEKILKVVQWLQAYRGSCVVHVGAGISTSAGIPDFRGPKGVWTKKLGVALKDEENKSIGKSEQEQQVKRISDEVKKEVTNLEALSDQIKEEISFDTAKPTFTHMALKAMVEEGYVSHIVSQNVDGLFLKANMDRLNISELHGNFYLDECSRCKSRYIRSTASTTMGLKKSTVKCPKQTCTGLLRDTILDWESPIPYNELRVAKSKSRKNRLHICMGTTMQLQPANQLPLEALKKLPSRGKLVVINLQPTKLEQKADLSIHHYCDLVMEKILSLLSLSVPIYDESLDPTKSETRTGSAWKSKKK